jgi:hypothetical protein
MDRITNEIIRGIHIYTDRQQVDLMKFLTKITGSFQRVLTMMYNT